MDYPIRGMETVVATVSGYHGSERFNLIKLISQAGANYVGAMSRSTTHLICWKFEGRKYDLAKKLKIVIVNHRWVEDCIKEGKRVPEHPYMLQSGKEVGPLLLEVPFIDKAGFSHQNREALSDKSNTFEDSERLLNGLGCGDSSLAGWTDSFLLNENLFPELNKNNINLSKSMPKRTKKPTRQKDRSYGRYCFQDPPLSGLVELEHENSSSKSSMHSVREKGKISGHEESIFDVMDSQLARGKRKISDDIGSTFLAEPPPNGRRLVKKNVRKNNLQIELSDSDQESNPIRLHNKNSEAAASSKYEGYDKNVNIFETGRASDAPLTGVGASSNEAFDDIEDIKDSNQSTTAKDSNPYLEEALIGMDGSESRPAIENFAGKNKEASVEPNSKSEDLSCIICWTEFCSTRGVLPCKHRFCYSCIQNWADQLISSRKNPTCPLCKARFVSITKVEHATTSDQKMYSQTIPCASTTDIFLLNDQERCRFGGESSLPTVCAECFCREPEDLLISCHYCQIQCIHMYCLDPPLLPWTCMHCKDLQRLYHHAR
ncbi:hypothetical protein JCGZ_25651 [Jatropha curcas]|uniref:RING-type E3 ubiquitin transferase BRCA1 n=1 Tax=Jatropha curcas TaxID=180498 RepID=A0A067JWH2_JATCU|nr:uncharacterized protein LOC105646808 [Jatropha curcas]XP_020540054.1 uncharacterized protein LOC105646808 [Jatropha curcas]KDP24355.1 hypothetical protein JCGZ_25651 [Jatropha curcas]